jgi:glycosyltransferase involved in cell wall biosynthesis
MHVNWYWINQRPHVIADGLAKNNEVYLMHYAIFKKRDKSPEPPPRFQAEVLWRIPTRLIKFNDFFLYINNLLIYLQVHSRIKKFKPDIVWVTHPCFESAVRNLGKKKLVYDCMDDHLEFQNENAGIKKSESELINKANLTIFSSKTLAIRVRARAPSGPFEIINNGCLDKFIGRSYASSYETVLREKAMGYYGTISHWFDWGLALKILEAIPNLTFKLAGPVETFIPSHPRIKYVGIVSRDSLENFSKECDALIMPFILNNLVRSVDPVKLYEYIAFGVPSIAPFYYESSRFTPYVCLYRSDEEAIEFLKAIIMGLHDPINHDSGTRFLRDNSWSARISQVEVLLSNI